MKRFYKTVTFDLKDDNLYYFYLDNKPIKTPTGHLLSTPSHTKANAVVTEWQAQTDDIILGTMPVTQYLNSVHDKIIPNYDFILNQLLQYADNDCIFYFTHNTDIDLYTNQQQYWLPIIQYFEIYYAAELNYGTDLILKNQCDNFKNHLQDFLKDLSYENLAGLYKIITLLGSVLLGIYAYGGHIDYDTALRYSRLEQDYNIQNWGLDFEAEQTRNFINQDYAQAVMFLKLG
jgi:chaperone required for assembly of F1-ATPase